MSSKSAAIKVIKELRANGFEALLAGGCVRDMLLGRIANDYDVATSAEPRDVIRLFKRTLKIGAHFGVIVVLLDDKQIEVATFRSEGGYVDGRHPTTVKFATAAEDATRRDFTVNGMFYNPIEDKVIDYVGGREDLEKKLIRTIGEPEERFGEDYLRMLRAVRFSVQLDFKIEPEMWAAIKSNCDKIADISDERKHMELEGILVHPNRSLGAAMLIKSGLAAAMFPGFVGVEAKKSIEVLSQLRGKVDFALALACFFVEFDWKFALEKCVALRLSRNQNRHIRFLLGNQGRLLDTDMSLADLRKLMAEPYFWDLYEFQRAIEKSRKRKKDGLNALLILRRRIRSLGDMELKPRPLLDGHALIKLGAKGGPQVGQAAEEMYIAQLEGELKTVEDAKKWVLNWLAKHRELGK